MPDLPDPYPIVPNRRVSGVVSVPGSKSITNRALVCAALADGESTLVGALDSDDTEAMCTSLEKLGARIAHHRGEVVVQGTGGVVTGDCALDVRASGTTMRFLAAVAALSDDWVVLNGVSRMRERPIGALVAALQGLGATVMYGGAPGYPPLELHGPLTSGRASVDASASSQFATALMLIGPVLPEGLRLRLEGDLTSRTYLQTTAEVMRAFGARVTVGEDAVSISPGGYQATRFEVEPDASAAVYPWVGAAMTGGQVTVAHLPSASTQADMLVLDTLESMGATVHRGERVTVTGPSDGLHGVTADLSLCPDGALGIAVAAAAAKSPSVLSGLHTLRIKETDRLEALRVELGKVGADVSIDGDRLLINPRALVPASIHTYDDHRIAMSFALLGLIAPGIRIEDPGCVAKTWPGFWDELDTMASPIALPVIAVDGPAGTGKTTVASRVAERLGGTRLDTGAFYRTATLLSLRAGIDPSDADAVAGAVEGAILEYAHGCMRLDGEDVSEAIRTPEVNANVSVVAAHPEVRARLVAQQRTWAAASDEVIVVEGRDIGTVVFPDAALKVYLDARPEVRAERRALEVGTTVEDELARLAERDRIDSTRDASPLRPADDAWILDTSDLTIDEVVDAIVRRYQAVAST